MLGARRNRFTPPTVVGSEIVARMALQRLTYIGVGVKPELAARDNDFCPRRVFGYRLPGGVPAVIRRRMARRSMF